jgi:hypothetical protein
VGQVGEARCEPEEEGLGLVGVDELQHRRHRRAAQLDTGPSHRHAVSRLLHAVGEAGQRVAGLPELARLEARIAVLLQGSGKGREVLDLGSTGACNLPSLERRHARIPLIGVESGQQGAQRRHADAGGAVAVPEDGARLGEPVQVGRLGVGGAHEAEVADPHVVADDQHQVGGLDGPRSGVAAEQPQGEGRQGGRPLPGSPRHREPSSHRRRTPATRRSRTVVTGGRDGGPAWLRRGRRVPRDSGVGVG